MPFRINLSVSSGKIAHARFPIADWQWIADYETPRQWTCISVGFLIAETKRAVAIAPNLGDLEHERIQASGILRIPRSAIRYLQHSRS
jgi:hypothetical protein